MPTAAISGGGMSDTDASAPDDPACGIASGVRPWSRSAAAAWLAVVALVLVCAARGRGFVYPHYLGCVIFQTAVLALLPIWVFPWATATSTVPRRSPAEALLGGYVGMGRLLRRRRDVRLVLRGILVAGTVAALAAFGQMLLRGKVGAVEQVQGHRNFLAMFLLPPILLAIADLSAPVLVPAPRQERPLRLPRVPVAVCLLPMLGALFACKSMGAMLGLGVGLVCLCAARMPRRARLVLLAAAAGVVVVGLAAVGRPAVSDWLLKRHGSQATRWFMWLGTLRMVGERPIAGWGTGMFHPHFADFKPTEPMRYGWLRDLTVYPHNELLLAAVEGGLIALALYVGALVTTVRRHLRAADRVVPWAIFACFAAMFVQGMVSVALRFWAPGAMFWTLIGLMLAYPRCHEKPSQAVKRKRGSVLRACLFVAVVGVVLLAGRQVVWSGARAEWLMSGGLKRQDATAERKIAGLAEAARLSRYVPDYFVALRKRAGRLRKAGKTNEAIAVYETIERAAPGYLHIRKLLGALYLDRAARIGPVNERQGKADLVRSVDLLAAAVEQDPYDPSTRLLLARGMMLASRRNLPQALAELDRALALCAEKQAGLRKQIEDFRKELLRH